MNRQDRPLLLCPCSLFVFVSTGVLRCIRHNGLHCARDLNENLADQNQHPPPPTARSVLARLAWEPAASRSVATEI